MVYLLWFTFSSLIRILLVSTTNLSISASLLSLNSLNLLLEAPEDEKQWAQVSNNLQHHNYVPINSKLQHPPPPRAYPGI